MPNSSRFQFAVMPLVPPSYRRRRFVLLVVERRLTIYPYALAMNC